MPWPTSNSTHPEELRRHARHQGRDLEIDKGEFIVFVGPSGCGKSTLLRLIAGLEVDHQRQALLDGKDITHTPSGKRDLAMVFQSYALYPHMSVFDNMSFALKLAGVSKDVIKEQGRTRREDAQPHAVPGRTPKELSGGQRQRVAIGRAIVRAPKVFLFDEPLSNLDAALRGNTRVEIHKLHRALGATSIYVTHDQVEAMTLADRVVVLRDGLIEQVGTPMELYDRPANQFVAQFIGMPSMNMVEAKAIPSFSAQTGGRAAGRRLPRRAPGGAARAPAARPRRAGPGGADRGAGRRHADPRRRRRRAAGGAPERAHRPAGRRRGGRRTGPRRASFLQSRRPHECAAA